MIRIGITKIFRTQIRNTVSKELENANSWAYSERPSAGDKWLILAGLYIMASRRQLSRTVYLIQHTNKQHKHVFNNNNNNKPVLRILFIDILGFMNNKIDS